MTPVCWGRWRWRAWGKYEISSRPSDRILRLAGNEVVDSRQASKLLLNGIHPRLGKSRVAQIRATKRTDILPLIKANMTAGIEPVFFDTL